jgi:ATP-dependent Clp protease ATP-binding subunit ClpB
VIRFDKLTVKAQEALQAAQSLADQHGHQSIEPEHLLLALIQQREGVVGPILAKLGARAEIIQRQLETELARLPRVTGGREQYLSDRLRAAVERAQTEAERLRDDYVSTEHLLIGIAQERDGAAGRVLAANGVSAEAIYRAGASWIPSSAATRRSAASFKSCRDGRRTIRSSSASRASARPPSSRASPSGSSPATCRKA